MGKGTIIGGGTDGQYQLQVNYNRVAYDAKISKLTNQIIEYATKISDKETEIITLENEYTSMVSSAFTPESLAAKRNEITSAEKEKASLTIYKLSFEKRKQYLENNMPADETVSAWCADLTEDLTGVVGTVEIPGESTFIQIQPGYDSNATYSQTRDGQLLPTVASTPAQTFYNLAMLPGWQKWKPLFRYATITAIDGNTASIALDNILSSQQALGINQVDTISGVSIEYMTCNGAAFEVGDNVLVKFTDQAWATPVIVGFKENPKACEYVFYIKPTFNGNIAVNGGQTIKITYTYNEELVSITGTVGGLSNPSVPTGYAKFIVTEGIGQFKAREFDVNVWLQSNFHGSNVASPIGTTFVAYYESDSSNYDELFYDYSTDPYTLYYAKRILWKESEDTLQEAESGMIIADEVEYPFFDVEFEELKVVRREPNAATKANTNYSFGTSCDLVDLANFWRLTWNYDNSLTPLTIYVLNDNDETPIYHFPYGRSSFIETGCGYTVCRGTKYYGDLEITRAQTFNEYCIESDIDGKNPTFSSWSRSQSVTGWLECAACDEWGENCEVLWRQDIDRMWGWTYEMIDTPVEAW